MPYRFFHHESVAEGVRRIAREQIERAIGEIDGDVDIHKTVHQVRKRCKKVRAVLRLVRTGLGETYSRENARFRDAAKRLSSLRDSTALIKTFDQLTKRLEGSNGAGSFEPIREALERRRRDLMRDDLDANARLAAFREEMEAAWADVGGWTVEADGFGAVRPNLIKTYDRGRRGLRRAYREPTDENLHELRKRAKYHWYHLRLLQASWKPIVRARREQQKKIADLLGDDHDLAVLEQTILAEFDPPEMRLAVNGFLRLVSKRRSELQTGVRLTAERLYAEVPENLADRFGVYWASWRHESIVAGSTATPPRGEKPPARRRAPGGG